MVGGKREEDWQTEPARLRVGDAGAPLDLLGQISRGRRLRKSTTQPLALKRLCNQASSVGWDAAIASQQTRLAQKRANARV